MKNIKKLSSGDRKLSPQAHFLLNVYLPTMSEMVMVPASVSNQLLVFNIEQELDRVEEFKTMAKEDLIKVIQVISQASGMLSDTDLDQLIEDTGFKGHAEMRKDLVKQIEQAVTRQIMQGAFSRIFMKDALSSNERSLNKNSLPRLTDIESAMWEIQELYASFATSMPIDQMVTMYNETISRMPVFDIARELNRLFNLNLTTTVAVRRSFALDSVFEYLTGVKNVDIVSKVPGILYQIEGVNRMNTLTFSTAMTAHQIMLRIVEKIPSAATMASPNLQQTVDAMVLGTGDIAPFLPPQLPDARMDDVESLVTELYTYFLIKRVIANDPGATFGAFEFIVDAKKYKRGETHDMIVREMQTQCSYVYEAFLDTCSYLKDLCTSSTIQYVDIHPVLQTRINKFYWERLGNYKTISYGRDDAKYLMNLSSVINHMRFDSESSVTENFTLADDQLDKWVGWPTSFKNFSAVEFLKSETLRGSERIAKISVDVALLGRINSVIPSYMVEIKNPSLISDYEIFTKYLGIQPVKKLKKLTNYFHTIKDRAEMVILDDKYEIAQKFKLPLNLAEKILKNKEEIFLAFKSLQSSVFVWEGDVAPIFEFSMTEETTLVTPHLSYYPFLISQEYIDGDGHNFVSIEGSVIELKKENAQLKDDVMKSQSELADLKIEKGGIS